ncbi:MAG: hypothetical protein O4752_11280 [Trichodesmium sp. St4_bin8_1]|nr:hypothetical protein [Trichodesmium sp. St4_bin8_1]
MYIQKIKQILIPSNSQKKSSTIFWLILSLTFTTIYSLLVIKEAFRGEYIVQDDARQHVFWMRRFLDPELFPNDLIADYFQSVAPWGYKSFYWLFSQVGIDPIFLNKLLPLGLSLVTTFYCFGLCFQILPIPFAGFLASVLLSQNLWFQDDIASGTPRAFLYPLFLAVLYYLLRKLLLPFLVAIALLGLFYPQYVIVTGLILIIRIFNWEKSQFYLSKNPQHYLFSGVGLGVSLLVILFYVLNSSNYAPIITASQAKILPEFGEAGRSVFFSQNYWDFFILGGRSGILPKQLFLPHILIVGLLLPILLKSEEGKTNNLDHGINFPRQLPLLKQISPNINLLFQILLAGVALFVIAHLLLFKLHLPSRYTNHSFRIVLAIGTAIVLCIILDRFFYWINQQLSFPKRKILGLIIIGILGILLISNMSLWKKKFLP